MQKEVAEQLEQENDAAKAGQHGENEEVHSSIQEAEGEQEISSETRHNIAKFMTELSQAERDNK